MENVLKRDFTTTSINEKWVGDITYIHTIKYGWCYLASVLDLHSKKIIGYAFGKRMTNELVKKALSNAYYSQVPDKNKKLIFHTDLGSQYTSNDLKELCKKFNIIQSFSKKGCPYDNACIESFHSSIKKEEIYRNKYRTFQMVWLSVTGKCYHRINNCGRMNPNKARQITKDAAIQQGYRACSKCW
ncbi:MAG: IS3 family transposase [Clostridiales bacterium]|nr:IS3 family transposase [Clostridiales bacterium]